jgi:hypothetical protein
MFACAKNFQQQFFVARFHSISKILVIVDLSAYKTLYSSSFTKVLPPLTSVEDSENGSIIDLIITVSLPVMTVMIMKMSGGERCRISLACSERE